MTTLAEELTGGYGFDDPAIILGRALDGELEHTLNEEFVQVPLAMLNRHGLVAGATGTGKTKTLQLFAEQLSGCGVPVFLADLKGDLTGLAQPSPGHPKIDERMQGMDLPWEPAGFPVEPLSLTGANGARLRVPVASFGPLLLSKVLDASETQESVLQVLFAYADDAGLALLDLDDLVATLKFLTSDEGKAVQADYGGMSTATLNVLLRRCIALAREGGDEFFGEPEFDVRDLLRQTPQGQGIVSVMNLTDVQDRPRLFSTFMMWLLAELYEELDEVGDLEQPRLVFFFDEAHLLFGGASKALTETIERTVRMIRSKGVGVYFVTQQPKDLPEGVLAQLGNRVQHALRASTPQDQKALKATAATFGITEFYDVRATLQALGTGEALISVLGPKGAPSPTVACRLLAPTSLMDPAPEELVARLMAESTLADKYAEELDRESAREILEDRAEVRATAAEKAAADVEDPAKPRTRSGTSPRSRRTTGERAARSAGAEVAEDLVSSLLKSTLGIKKGTSRPLLRGLLGNLRRGR